MSDTEIISNLRSIFGKNHLSVKNVKICDTLEVAITFIAPDESEINYQFESAHSACNILNRFKLSISEKNLNLIERTLESEKHKSIKKAKNQKKKVEKKGNGKESISENNDKSKNKKPATLEKIEIYFNKDAAFIRNAASFDTVRWSINELFQNGNAYSSKTGIPFKQVFRKTVFIKAFAKKEIVAQSSFTFPDSIALKYFIPIISTRFDVESEKVTIVVCKRKFYNFESAICFIREKIREPFKVKYLKRLRIEQRKWINVLEEKKYREYAKWHTSPQKDTTKDKNDLLAERQKEIYGN